MKLTDKLRDSVADLWQKEIKHPFVQGIANGTLPKKNFQYFMKQDYLFLVEFSRAIAIAIGKSRNLTQMEWLSHLLNETLQTEMNLHVEYCLEVGISREDLLVTDISPTTHAYTKHILETAYSGSTIETEVAILPCCWRYAEIGRKLREIETENNQPHLSKWIALYSSKEFWDLSHQLKDLINKEAASIDIATQTNLIDIFVKSTHYEYRFWEAAYTLEDW